MRVIVLLATLTLLASSSIVTASTPADSDEAVQGPKLQDWLQSVIQGSSSTRAAAQRLGASHHEKPVEKDFLCLKTSLQTSCAGYFAMR